MSDRFTCGVAIGTELAVARAVTRAVVREDGIECTFRDILFGNPRTKLVKISVDEYSDWINGTCIQDAMPHVDADTRELFLTGMVW